MWLGPQRAFPLLGLVLCSCLAPCSAQYIPQSVLQNPPKDAVVISTWAFLKESMEKVGNQVMQLLEVKRDAQAIEDDLVAQKTAWHQEELAAMQENAKLRAEKEAIEAELNNVAGVRSVWLDIRNNISAAKAQVELLEVTQQREESHRALEQQSLQQRQKNIRTATARLAAVTKKEKFQAWQQVKKLQEDAKDMRQKIWVTKKKIGQMAKEDKYQAFLDAKEMKITEERLAKLNRSRATFQNKIKPASDPKQELKDLQDQLQKDTKDLLKLKNTENTHQIACQRQTSAAEKALGGQRNSLAVRTAKLRQTCDRARGLHEVFKHEFAACNEVLRPHHQDFNKTASADDQESGEDEETSD